MEKSETEKNSQEKLTKRLINDLTKKSLGLHHEVRKNAATAIAAAFGFVIGTAWKDVVQSGVDKALIFLKIVSPTQSVFISKIITASFITLLGVIAIIYINKWGQEKKNEAL